MSFPANVIPIFGSQRPYVDLNFALGSFGVNGGSVSSLALLSGFTFTRASLAMGYDPSGKLTYGPNNLLLQSQTFGTGWAQVSATVTSDATTAPDGTLTADKLVEAAATAQHFINQNQSVQIGVPFVTSVYAKAGERNWLRIQHLTGPSVWFNLATGTLGTVTAPATAGMVSVGNGWYRCYVAGVSSSGTTYFFTQTANNETSYTGDGTSGIYLWGAQLEAVTYQTTPSTYYPTTTAAYYGPRLVYDPVTLASLGILVEEARTNSVLQSNTFSTTWTNGNITLTAGSITGPDGTASGWKFQNTLTLTTSFYQSAVINATAATASVFVKVGSSTTNVFVLRNVSTATDLISGTLTWATPSISGSGWSITNVGNGWYRVIGTASTGITSGDTLRFYVGHAGSLATMGEFFYGYQAQLEAGTGASSPILTTTAAVTRAADDATLTVSIASGAMVSEAYGSPKAGLTQVASHVSLSNADDSTAWVIFGQTNMSGNITAFRRAAGVSVNTASSSTFAAGARAKIAMRFGSPSGDAVSVNGAAPVAIAAAAAPLVVTQLRVGRWASDPGYLNNTISRIRIYNRALPDAQLQSLTS